MSAETSSGGWSALWEGMPEVDLLELSVLPAQGGTLRLVVDHPDGVDHGVCADVTRALDRAGLLDDYGAEVWSPGPEPPLRTPEHFRRAVGRRVKVRAEAADGRRSFTVPWWGPTTVPCGSRWGRGGGDPALRGAPCARARGHGGGGMTAGRAGAARSGGAHAVEHGRGRTGEPRDHRGHQADRAREGHRLRDPPRGPRGRPPGGLQEDAPTPPSSRAWTSTARPARCGSSSSSCPRARSCGRCRARSRRSPRAWTPRSTSRLPDIDWAAYEDEIQAIDVTPDNFGRIAAQTAKQVILQRIREAEREMMYEEYVDRVGDVVTGIIQQSDSRYTLVDLGRVEALLPRASRSTTSATTTGRASRPSSPRCAAPPRGRR